MSAVINQRVNGFLKHTRFVPDNDVRRIELEHPLQTVVTVDDSAVEVIEVGGCISAAVQHDHRADIGRNHRQNCHNHPFRTVAGLTECLKDFEALQQLAALLALLRGCADGGFFIQLAHLAFELFTCHDKVILPFFVLCTDAEGAFAAISAELTVFAGFELIRFQIELAFGNQPVAEFIIAILAVFLQQVQDCLCTDFRLKTAGVLRHCSGIFFFGQGLLLEKTCHILSLMHRIRLAGIGNDIFCEINDCFEILLGDIAEYLTDAGRGSLEVPDMRDRSRQLNVTHALAANLCAGDFNAAVRADLALEAHLLELAAVALPVFGRSENLFAEQAALFGLLCAVVDCFRTLNLAVAPLQNLFR